MPGELSTNAVSLAGEFAALSQLVLRGFDANLTLGKTKEVDILGSDPRTGTMFQLEVKTNFAGRARKKRLFGHVFEWRMSKKHEEICYPSLFYCFVKIDGETDSFRFFVVPSRVVADYVKREHAYYLVSRKARGGADNDVRMFRIGLDDGDYPLDTPLAKKYERRWEILRRSERLSRSAIR